MKGRKAPSLHNPRLAASAVVALATLLACGRTPQTSQARAATSTVAPCFDPGPASAPHFWNQRVSVALGAGSIAESIELLRRENHLPISFIEGRSHERASAVSATREPVGDLVRRLLESVPGYQCKIVGGHVVVLSDAAEYAATLRGVRITAEPRAVATRAYIERLTRKVDALDDLEYSVRSLGGLIDESLLDHTVTLAREATVLEHLSQLLGDDPQVYFSIRRGVAGRRDFALGSVPESSLRWRAVVHSVPPPTLVCPQ